MLEDSGQDDKVSFYSKEVRILLYRLYLRLLNIQKSSYDMIQFFRKGDFKAGNR